MAPEQLSALASVLVAFLALIFTSILLARQARQMEHERNAVALLEAISRLTSAHLYDIFDRLSDIDDRYPTDEDIAKKYPGSKDEHDFMMAGAYVETVACLARRGVLDPSLLVDAVGFTIRRRWNSIRRFVERRRRVQENPYIMDNFQWLAMYSAWWKDTPRPHSRNYAPKQFAGVQFRV